MNKVVLMGRLTKDPDVRYASGEGGTSSIHSRIVAVAWGTAIIQHSLLDKECLRTMDSWIFRMESRKNYHSIKII